ncbi:MAG: hypothetical protein JSS66_05120 [Armatimonadetes bacterium]|nr:hypothetical protein [Armatimonadota bacterium]
MWYRTLRLAGKKGKKDIHGIEVYIEYPKGSTREKTGPDGKKWSRVMQADYGRISGTEGADDDCVDVFLGPDLDSEKVFVVNQTTEEGDFDEHKCVLGCNTKTEAHELYASNYPKDWKVGKITSMELPEFKSWLKKGDKSKPA